MLRMQLLRSPVCLLGLGIRRLKKRRKGRRRRELSSRFDWRRKRLRWCWCWCGGVEGSSRKGRECGRWLRLRWRRRWSFGRLGRWEWEEWVESWEGGDGATSSSSGMDKKPWA